MNRFDPLGYVLRGLIQAYRYSLSPLIGHNCRHEPTCSHYALEAVRRYGGWHGGWLALARLSRCRPGGSHGFDPVPDAGECKHNMWRPWSHGIWSPQTAMARRDQLLRQTDEDILKHEHS